MEDQRTSMYLYAETFARIAKTGLRFITFRDLPDLIGKYVKGTKTLDYGCGAGQSTECLKSLGLDVVGMDINEHMLKISKKVDPNGKYCLIKSGKIPTPDACFDLVYAGYVLIYVATKRELIAIVKEIVRVLEPSGTFIAAMTNENTYKYQSLEEDTDFEENKNLVSGAPVKLRVRSCNIILYQYYWTEQDYCEAMSEAGLEVICIHRGIGKDSDGIPWVTEKLISPCTIYVGKKVK